MSIKRFLALGFVALAVLLGVVGAASAGSYTTGFEGFALGTVNGQDGWHSAVPGDIPALPNGYDQEVVNTSGFGNPTGFGTEALRMSNAYTNGEFKYQTYSPSVTDPAGETQTNKVFDGTFQFISTSTSPQPGLALSVSPDNGEGARMSYVNLVDNGTDGIDITFADTLDGTNWRYFDAGTYPYNKVVTVEFLIETVPGYNADGTPNDIVRLIINGTDIGDELHACFTTWEQYYRNFEKHEPGVINSLEFRAGGTAVPALLGGGYLFDNVTTDARNTGGPAPTTCGVPEVGRILPTGTTCQQYKDGTVSTLGQVVYTTKGTVINSVSPGVFFYYTQFTGGVKNDQVDITESQSPSYTAIPVQQGQAFLYDLNTCTKVKWNPTTNQDGSVTGTLPADGDYIIGVKYNPSALKGQTAPTSPPVTYSYETKVGGNLVDTGASVDLALKK